MEVLCDRCAYKDHQYGRLDGEEFPSWHDMCVNPMVLSKNPNKTYCPLFQEMTCEICYWYTMNPQLDYGYCASDINLLMHNKDFESLEKCREDGIESIRSDNEPCGSCGYGHIVPIRTCTMCKHCEDIKHIDGGKYEYICKLNGCKPFTVEYSDVSDFGCADEFGCTMWDPYDVDINQSGF